MFIRIFLGLSISFNLFAADSYDAEVTWNSKDKIREEAIYKKINGTRGELIARRIYKNFKLSEVYIDARSWSGDDKEAKKRVDSFINSASETRAETEVYSDGEMRKESVNRYVGNVKIEQIAGKIFQNKTNKLMELYVDGASTIPDDKNALEKIDIIFKNATIQNSQSNDLNKENVKRPIDCITALMSDPSCIDRLNATNACKNKDNDEEYIKLIQGCITQMSKPGDSASRKNNIIAMCLGGFTSSSKASSKETFCNGDTTKPIFINDSAKNKLKETIPVNDSTPKNESGAVPK